MSSPPSPTNKDMPVRTSTSGTGVSDEAGDPADPLFNRFKAWHSVIDNLIEYFEGLELVQKTLAKEYGKLSKSLEVPFKSGEFAADGLAAIWQGMRNKNSELAQLYTEESHLIKTGVLANLNRLKGDIKKHLHDLNKEGIQGSKKVDKRMGKFSDVAQALGKWIPVAETNPTSLEADHDPYVLSRIIKHKLHKAVDEENALNEQLFALQHRCQHFDSVIMQAIQKAMRTYADQVGKETQFTLRTANEINDIAMRVPPEKEWEEFTARESSLLKPDHKPRDPASVTFPFSDHRLVQPVLAATLARKGTMLKRLQSAFYVLTPSGFLLEYKNDDHFSNPEPVLSLKLADCELGNPPSKSGTAGFTLRGKNTGKAIGMTHDYTFRTDSMEQATKWWTSIQKYVGAAPRDNIPVAPAEQESDEEEAPGSVHSTKQAQPAQAAEGQKIPETKTSEPVTTAPQANTTAAGPESANSPANSASAQPTNVAAKEAGPTTAPSGTSGPPSAAGKEHSTAETTAKTATNASA